MSRIELINVDKYYGKNHVLKNLNLLIENGDFMTLLGPSGCGKTTTLRVISGLEKPQHGLILMDGKEIVNAEEAYFTPPSRRNLNLVFQSYALWPHMTVFNNIAFGLKTRKMPSSEITTRVYAALERMQIGEFAKRYPSELSGGQQQRVAIARAIVSEPHLLLLDEPLSNLDAKLRIDMRSELKRLHHETGTTIIYVTHDQVEALTMSTKVALFRQGELVQVAAPLDLYDNPCNLYTADFIGNPGINFIPCTAEAKDGKLSVKGVMGSFAFGKDALTASAPSSGSFDAVLGIRPEQLTICRTPDEAHPVAAKIYSSMPAGSETLVSLRVGENTVIAKELGSSRYTGDETVYIGCNPDKCNIFAKESGELIKYCR